MTAAHSPPGDKAADIHRRPVRQLASDLRDGTCSASGLLDHFLERIARLDPRLNAFTFVDPQAAAAAAQSDARFRAGRPLSALDGIPVAVKDNLWVRDCPATWGAPLYADLVAARDEWAVAELRARGAIFIGKTNCPEFASRGTTTNNLYGATANPWDLTRTPGGSSGGAVAAVATGLAPLSLATDGGGSIRRPAGYTGLVGLKPSMGRVRRGGGFPQIIFDCEVIGPIARDVAGARAMFEAMAGGPRPSPPGGKRRILYVGQFGAAPVDTEIAGHCHEVAQRFSKMGHEVTFGALPFSIDKAMAAWSALLEVGLARIAAQESRFFELAARDFGAMAKAGAAMSAAACAGLIEALLDFRVEAARAFDVVDVIMTPANAAPAWGLETHYPPVIAGTKVGPRGHAVFTGWVNACGHPAIALPGPPAASGMPIGFQLVGALGADEVLLDIAEAYEVRHPWAGRWPAGFD